jgi:hypothetical protein
MKRLLVVAAMVCGPALFPTSALAVTTPDTPGAQLTLSQATNKVFYPYVHDGYKDGVHIGLYYEQPSGPNIICYGDPILSYPTATITNDTSGLVVRTLTPLDDSWGDITINWDGKKDDGTLVSTGQTFTVHVQIDDANCDYHPAGSYIYPVQTPAFDIAGITPVTKVITQRKQAYRDGTATSSRAKTGPCYFENAGNRDLTLDSWGGRCAASWTITLPKGASKLFTVADWGRNSQLDNGGPVSHSVTRTKTGYRFSCSIGGWAAFDINAVWVNYSISKRL